MHVAVIGKNMDVGDAFRSHISDSLEAAVGKYFDKALEATVTVTRDAHLYRAQMSAHTGRDLLFQSTGEAPEPYPAFDRALDRLAKRLRRHKRRLKDHHRTTAVAIPAEPVAAPARQYILDAEAEDPHMEAVDGAGQPLVVAEMDAVIETLTVSEAVMRMDLEDHPALLFRNRAHGTINMVYRRPDGHIGWVDPGPQAPSA
jgi:ribosomal subunit interface protein